MSKNANVKKKNARIAKALLRIARVLAGADQNLNLYQQLATADESYATYEQILAGKIDHVINRIVSFSQVRKSLFDHEVEQANAAFDRFVKVTNEFKTVIPGANENSKFNVDTVFKQFKECADDCFYRSVGSLTPNDEGWSDFNGIPVIKRKMELKMKTILALIGSDLNAVNKAMQLIRLCGDWKLFSSVDEIAELMQLKPDFVKNLMTMGESFPDALRKAGMEAVLSNSKRGMSTDKAKWIPVQWDDELEKHIISKIGNDEKVLRELKKHVYMIIQKEEQIVENCNLVLALFSTANFTYSLNTARNFASQCAGHVDGFDPNEDNVPFEGQYKPDGYSPYKSAPTASRRRSAGLRDLFQKAKDFFSGVAKKIRSWLSSVNSALDELDESISEDGGLSMEADAVVELLNAHGIQK